MSRPERSVPRARIVHAAVALAVTVGGALVLLWLSIRAPAFASMLRGAIAIVVALGAWWVFKTVQPRTHGDRRDGDRRDHPRREGDPPPDAPDVPAPGRGRVGS